MVPSLYTFFEDLKCLEPAAKIIRKLLPPGEKTSLRSSLSAHYFAPERNTFEFPEGEFHTLPSHIDNFESGYHQLWLFALRNFPEMINMSPRKEPTRRKPLIVEPSPIVWRKLSQLAVQLGFRTAPVESLCAATDQESSLRVIKHLGYDAAHNHSILTDLTEVLSKLRKTPTGSPAPSFVSDAELSLERRCGRPFEGDHFKDKNRLFLPSVYKKDVGTGHDITTMFCKRHMVRTFLGIAENAHIRLEPTSLEVPEQSSYNGSPHQYACSDLSTRRDTAERELAAYAKEKANAIRTVAIKESEILALRERLLQTQCLASQQQSPYTSCLADREQLVMDPEIQLAESSANYKLQHNEQEAFRRSNNDLLLKLRQLQGQHEQMEACTTKRIAGVELDNGRFREERNAHGSREAGLNRVVLDLQNRIAIADEQAKSLEAKLSDAERQIAVCQFDAEGNQRRLQIELEDSKRACTDATQSQLKIAEELEIYRCDAEENQRRLQIELKNLKRACTDDAQSQSQLVEELELQISTQKGLKRDWLQAHTEATAYSEEAEKKQRQLQTKLQDSERACTDATQSRLQLAEKLELQLSAQKGLKRELLEACEEATESRVAKNVAEKHYTECRAIVEAGAEGLDPARSEIIRLEERVWDLATVNEKHAHTKELATLENQQEKPLDQIYSKMKGGKPFPKLRICHLVDNMVDERTVIVPDFWAEELVRAMKLCNPISLNTTAYLIGHPPKRIAPSQLEESEKSSRAQKEAFLKDHWILHGTLTICPLEDVEAVVCQTNDPRTYYTPTVLGKRNGFNQSQQVPQKRHILANRKGQ
ncbi:hypothetical protein LTR54_017522 [Friedmanniomyces endolithicus]|nr:hypothetical protein LTR54_017522 [Friedmanniomyces endolithicus]